jgi:hypothetical protein
MWRTRPSAAGGSVGRRLPKIWADWGPRVEYSLQHAASASDFPGASFLDVPRLLSDPGYREVVLRYVADSRVEDFWRKEFAKYPPTFRAEAISPIQSKVGQSGEVRWPWRRHRPAGGARAAGLTGHTPLQLPGIAADRGPAMWALASQPDAIVADGTGHLSGVPGQRIRLGVSGAACPVSG